MSKEKILVFGASGDIGTYFVDYLRNSPITDEYDIAAVGTRECPLFEKWGIPYYRIDITDSSAFSVLPTNVYAVADFAGAMPARMKGYKPELYLNTNIRGTFNILEFCRKNNVERLLFSQSFGDIKDHANENPLLKPDMTRNFSYNNDHTVYIISKNAAVDLIENYHQAYGLKSFIFRLPTIYLYSPIDTYYVDGVLRKIGYRLLMDRAAAGEPIEVWGNPERFKDMIYVKDLCLMFYLALKVNKTSGLFNVGTGVGTSLLEQIQGMIDVFSPPEKKSDIIFAPNKPDAPSYVMDITNAREELGFCPQFSYRKWLEDFKTEMTLKRFL